MNYTELKPIFERIKAKVEETERLNKIKSSVDERTYLGMVTITFENQSISVTAQELKNLLDVKIQANDLTADFSDLKNKAK